jgi:hypothetical protein
MREKQTVRLPHRHPRAGTSAVGACIADENGDTARKLDHRRFSELHPGHRTCPARDSAARRLTGTDLAPQPIR